MQISLQQKRLSKCLESLARRERRVSVPRVTSRHNHELAGERAMMAAARSMRSGGFSCQAAHRGCGYDTRVIRFSQSRLGDSGCLVAPGRCGRCARLCSTGCPHAPTTVGGLTGHSGFVDPACWPESKPAGLLHRVKMSPAGHALGAFHRARIKLCRNLRARRTDR